MFVESFSTTKNAKETKDTENYDSKLRALLAFVVIPAAPQCFERQSGAFNCEIFNKRP